MSNIRIRTTPGGEDKFLNVKIDQKFDFIEILSLKIAQEDVYRKYCSDYGVLVGRVTVNTGFGVPNAKVSIFIPIDSIDKEDSEIFGLYPYEQVQDKNVDGLRYNLLPKINETNNNCFTPVGSFFNKREVQDNSNIGYIYCKYYKFTTTTNASGDFMLFGVPTGSHQIHIDADISNIGTSSQFPYDLIREGSNEKLFETTAKFKQSNNLNTLSQIKTKTPISVNIKPFWGDLDQCEIGITRNDIDLGMNIVPSAIFMGSIFGDNDKGGINKQCRANNNLGKFKNIITGTGTIEMIRQTPDGVIEQYDVEGGELIDENGAWAYQVPMNLDYITTDEFGNIIPTDDINIGIPTRARVRFRIGMDTTGNEGKLKKRAKYLVPHNPKFISDTDFNFSEKTRDGSFFDMYWNKIYTIANHIPKYGDIYDVMAGSTAIKDIDDSQNTPFPFNRVDNIPNFGYVLFGILCMFYTIFVIIVSIMNVIITVINSIIEAINGLLSMFGLNGINYIKYLVMNCDGQRYCITCCDDCPGFDITENPKIADPGGLHWIDCMSAQLAIGLNMVKFNFYNDWVNGSLYAFPFKSKKRGLGSGKEKFCDWNCSDNIDPTDNNNDGLPDNKCYVSTISDSCTHAPPQSSSSLPSLGVTTGLIKKNSEEDEYYYTPIIGNNTASNATDYKLFATKIINLGSIYDCDWQGIPKFHQYLVDTTYNAPNESKMYHDNTDADYPGELEENGYDNLLATVICPIGVFKNDKQCNNGRRICELGMGIDEDRRDPLDGSGLPVNGVIQNEDVENPWIRGLFTYLNIGIPSIPLVYIDNLSFTPDFNYKDTYYEKFRGYDDLIANNPNLWQFKNSYYFYFGIIPGSSALQKMNKKYFPECVVQTKNELTITIDSVIDDNQLNPGTGQIKFHVEGGSEPYTYQWIGPSYGGIQFICPDPDIGLDEVNCGNSDGTEFTLENLLGGQYTLIVNDSNNMQATITVELHGFNGVHCELIPTPIDATNNGKVIININAGVIPYTVEIQGITDSSFNAQFTTTSLNYCYGKCDSSSDYPNAVNSLPAGEYIVTVTDSGVGAIYSECIKPLLITQPIDIDLNVSVIDAMCYNTLGEGQISINGGVPPYSISWELTSTSNLNYDSLVGTIISTNINPTNLPPGTYNITINDLAGNIKTSSAVINEPSEMTILNMVTNSPGCALSASGHLSFDLNGPNPPYTIEVAGDTIIYLTNQINGLIELNNLPSSINPYIMTITDNNNCQISENVTIPKTLHGKLYVRTTIAEYVDGTGTPNIRVRVKFKGGNGGPYHFKTNSNDWILIGDPYTIPPTSPVTTGILPNYELYYSDIVDGEQTYEFQFWLNDIPGQSIVYPFSFDYYLSDNGQQATYGMVRGKSNYNSVTNNINSQDSFYGTIAPYGCYSYVNSDGYLVNGSTPQGILLTHP